jgi:hypothetical protein
MIGVGYNTLAGEYDLAWQVVSWVLAVAVELIGFLAGLALLDQKFRGGRLYTPSDTSPLASSGEIFSNDANNHAAVEDRQEATGRNGAESENENTQGIWFRRPDDPSPIETSLSHNDKEESDSIPPLQPQPEYESDACEHCRKLDEPCDEGLIDPKGLEARRRLLDRIWLGDEHAYGRRQRSKKLRS